MDTRRTPTPQRVIPIVNLVLIPSELFEQGQIVQMLHIRSGLQQPFEIFPIDKKQLERYFKHYNELTAQTLQHFMAADLLFVRNLEKKKIGKSKSGTSLERYLSRYMTKYIYSELQSLLKQIPSHNWYHKYKNPQTGNYTISRCAFHEERVAMAFEVIKLEDKSLDIRVWFNISGKLFALDTINRYKFLLQIAQDYYFLDGQSYQMLEWLAQSNYKSYAHDGALFSKHIIEKLEEEFVVERNNLFEEEVLQLVPERALLLSELSDSLLVLHPRWIYDGISIDSEFQEHYTTIRNGTTVKIVRNQAEETAFLDYIKALHPNFAKQSKYFYLPFKDALKKQWFLKAYHQMLADNVALIGLEMLKNFRYSAHPVVTELEHTHTDGHLMTLQLRVLFGNESVSLKDIQKSLWAGQNSMLLKDNTIGVFDEQWMLNYGPILKHARIIDSKTVVIAKWIAIALLHGDASSDVQQLVATEWREKWFNWQDTEEVIYPVPTCVKAALRPYQQKGFEWMCLLNEIGAGGILADDMGLGKTLQTICFLAHQYELQPNAKHIIVCPASLIYNWSNELEKFAPHLKTHIFNGTQRSIAHFCDVQEDYQIMITSYGTLRSDIEQLKVIPWRTLIADESQHMKNLTAQITKAVCQIPAEQRFALSGTPVMNNTFDLYAQIDYLLPDYLGSQEFFKKTYALPIDRDANEDKMKQLQKLTSPYILRRSKEQVAKDLPEKTEQIIWCTMSDEQQIAYDTIKDQIKTNLFSGIQNDGFERSKINILAGITKLRQVCASPQLLQETAQYQRAVKMEMLLDNISKLQNDSKALVFSQFKGMLHLIAAKCKELGISYYHFDGDTPISERAAMVAAFQEAGNTTKLFLISLKSGNAGLNLTAADYVYLIDPWWNNAVEQQAIDRTHRIGQTKNVFAYKMICKNSIEEKIILLQNAKKQLSEGIVGKEDGFVKQLTLDDVKYMFD